MSGDIVQYCRTRKRMREVIDVIDEVSDRLDSMGKPGFVSGQLSDRSDHVDKAFVPPVHPAGSHPDDKDGGVSG